MRKILSWYLLKSFWISLLGIVFTFIFLVFFADILDNLDDFISYDLPLSQYLRYYLFTVPTVFVICLPVAVLLSSMRLFRNLSINNEYVALIMGGIPLKKMILPIAGSAFFLSLLSFYVSDRVAPVTRFRRKVMQKEKFKIDLKVLRNRNLIGRDGRKYYLNEYHKNERRIRGLMITETDVFDRISERTFAEEVVWDGERWKAARITIQSYSPEGLPEPPRSVTDHVFTALPRPSEILLSRREPKYLDLKSLKSLIRSIPPERKKVRAPLEVDYYRKYSLAFLPFIILFVAVPFSIAPIRSASTKTLGFGIILCLVYYIVDAVFYKAGCGLLIAPPFAAWGANAIFAAIGFGLMSRVPR
jgi:LPS export ABC transporter permease LptG